MRAFLLSVALAGCAPSEQGLAAIGHDNLAPTDDLGDGAGFAAWETPAADGPARDAVALAPADRPALRIREEVFALGPTAVPVADFLFVVDDSISMRNVVTELRRGMVSMRVKRDRFPANTRIAVMHTTPADPADRTMPHLSAWNDEHAHQEPGFLGLVDGERIATYQAATSGRRRRWRGPGCTAWFAPDDRAANGWLCLATHLTRPRLRGGGDGLGRAEAGLVALRQWLEDTEGTPRFRAGAAVNVVFVSDTHDPGLGARARERRPDWAAELDAERPDFAELVGLVDDPVASFRVHAIAPAPGSDCGEDFLAPTYFDVVREAGGETADICTADDYAELVGRIAQSGSRRQRPVLRLGYPAAGIRSVRMDGVPVDWSFTRDPQAIRIHVEAADTVRRVAVRYESR